MAEMTTDAVSRVPAQAVGTESVGEKITSNAARMFSRLSVNNATVIRAGDEALKVES